MSTAHPRYAACAALSLITSFAPTGIVPRASTDCRATSNPHLATALTVIRSGACQPLSVTELVAAVHLSRRTLERLFRRELGHSGREEILHARLQRACQLLRETNRKVTDITNAAGFADYGRFTRIFRTAHGATPTGYRDRFRHA